MSAGVKEKVVNIPRLMALEIDRVVADSMEAIVERARGIAETAWKECRRESDELQESQLHGLAAIAVAAATVQEIDRYVEKQTGRRPPWAVAGPQLRQAMKELQEDGDALALAVGDRLKGAGASDEELKDLRDNRGRSRRLHLRLAQELVASFTSAYEYARWLAKQKREGRQS